MSSTYFDGRTDALAAPADGGWVQIALFQGGGAGDDSIEGGAEADTLWGAEGADTLRGNDGGDFLAGFYGNSGESAPDVDGADLLDGGNGDDTLRGNAGNDTLLGGDGDDNLRGDAGDDLIEGGAGIDFVSYRFDEFDPGTAVSFDASGTGVAGSMQFSDGRGGTDTLVDIERIGFTGSVYDDTAVGGAGDDQLVGYFGNDSLAGGAGDDNLAGNAGNDTLDGGAGNDYATYAFNDFDPGAAVFLDASATGSGGTVTVGDGTGGTDTLVDVERVYFIGSGYNDTAIGGAGDDQLEGGAGNDALNGRGGSDTLLGGDGDDFLYGYTFPGSGESEPGADAADSLDGGAGNDLLRGNAGDDTLLGGAGNDNLRGDAGNDLIDGGDGVDVASYRFDEFDPGGGVLFDASSLVPGGGPVAFDDGRGGVDQVSGIEAIIFTGSGYDDTATGTDGGDQMSGRSGNDSLVGGAGNDNLIGDDEQGSIAAGSDTLVGGGGDDWLRGGGADDTLIGGDGNDTFSGDSGTDTLDFSDSGTAIQLFKPINGSEVLEELGTVVHLDGSGTPTGEVDRFFHGTADIVLGSAFNDLLVGAPVYTTSWGEVFGDDDLHGGGGDDTIRGLGGDDFLVGDDGNDLIQGGTSSPDGNVLIGGAGNDTLDGSGGTSYAVYAFDGGPVQVNLATGSATDGSGGTDTLIHISGAGGSAFDDTLTGGDGNDEFAGFLGNDSIVGGLGFDTVYYDDEDFVFAGIALNLGLATPVASGNGADTLIGIEGVVGSRFNDTLTGDGNANLFVGGAGTDSLLGGGGNDTLDGGDGDDTLAGGDGNDQMSGGSGFDIFGFSNLTLGADVNLASGLASGATGNDTLSGIDGIAAGQGNDTLTGSAAGEFFRGYLGDDVIDGGAGIDRAAYDTPLGFLAMTTGVTVDLVLGTATGGAGSDTLVGIENLRGSDLADVLTGDANANDFQARGGDDSLDGGEGNDTLQGEAGNDTLLGGGGEDFLIGGDGDDSIVGGAQPDNQPDTAGNPGRQFFDIADYTGAGAAVSANLATTVATGGGGNDTLVGIEGLRGSAYDDTLTGDDGANLFRGNAGDDLIDGGAGNDVIDFNGASGGVSIDMVAGTATGAAGNDSFSGIESAIGTGHADTIVGDDGNNAIRGNGGDDSLDGGAGTDRVDYRTAAGAVTVNLLEGMSSGADGNDTLANFENIRGSDLHDDSLTGDGGANAIEGRGGDDQLRGEDGNDTLVGDEGDDELEGGAGDDSLVGGASGGDGNGLFGGAGNDTLDGRGGTSYAIYRDATSQGIVANLATGEVSNDGFGNADLLIEIAGIGGTDLADSITGSDFDDAFAGFGGDDTIDGGAGFDTVYYDQDDVTAGITVNLAGETASGANIGNDSLTGIEAVVGGAGGDSLTGTADGNRLEGWLGNDSLLGGGGDDTLDGGDGDDTLAGGDGNDQMSGGSGFDIFGFSGLTLGADVNLASGLASGATGNDTLSGIDGIAAGQGNDTLTGTAAGEFFRGYLGNDVIDGGAGIDRAAYDTPLGFLAMTTGVTVDLVLGTATGGAGSDTLVGIENLRGSDFADVLIGNDVANDIQGRAGNDTITGNAGDDFLQGEDGDDSLLGGAGEDVLAGGSGNDVLDGGATHPADPTRTFFDVADFSTASGAVTVNLGAGIGSATGQGSDTLLGIEGARGGNFDDVLTGDALDNVFRGNGGNDTMAGDAGFDALDYGNAGGSVTVNLGAGSASGAAGNDSFSGMEMAVGGAFDDMLIGSGGNDVLRGGRGNDVLTGGSGTDRADYRTATGAVTVDLYAGRSSGADGVDTLSGIENVRGTDLHNDRLGGNGANNLLEGRGGADTLVGGAGNDTLAGGTITDLINYTDLNQVEYTSSTSGIVLNLQTNTVQDGLGGTDALSDINWVVGSDFADAITGSTRLIFEQFTGGAGNDTIDGGAVTDTLNQTNVNRVSYANTHKSVTVDLAAGTASGISIGNDLLFNIQQVAGSTAADGLFGSNGTVFTEQFRGLGGNDTIDGRGGFDMVRYDVGNSGVAVVVNLVTGTASDGQGGTDTLLNIEGARGGNFADTLIGGNSASDALEVFVGMAGNDSIDGGSGFDRVDYTPSIAGVVVTLGFDSVAGSASDGYGWTDTLRNIEGVRGSSFGDVLTGSQAATLQTFEGREGNDTIDGVAGLDRVVYQFSTAGVTVNLGTGTASDGYGGTDTLSNIDEVQGSRDFADSLIGNAGANRLEGLGGNDTLNGGAGIDTLLGGAGNDTYLVDLAGDVASESAGSGVDTVLSTATSYTLGDLIENLTLQGIAGIAGTGNALNNVITGNAGANTLNGGGGTDQLIGGAGNDTYIVDLSGDVVTETSSGGTADLVRSTATSYTLGAFVENLTLDGTAGIAGTGNTLNNVITGNAGSNTLDGGAGIDTLLGGAGNDTYLVDVAGDVASESAGSGIDTVRSTATTYTLGDLIENLTLQGIAGIAGNGNALANTIIGNAGANALNGGDGIDRLEGGDGNDTLDGGIGADADVMIGGNGNDSYIVDFASDTITETSTGGTLDSVASSVSYTLAPYVEILTLGGSAAINGTGNEQANTLIGNAANNILSGLAGNDVFDGNAGNDLLLGGDGNDSLVGDLGNDTLDGDAGTDTLVGGDGNDVYIVDGGETVNETGTSASTADLVRSTVTWTLGGTLENLTLEGTAVINGTGNGLANTITGNAAANLLNGLAGNDVLSGGSGNDVLAGGLGNDTLNGGLGLDAFLFNTTLSGTLNVDRISGYVVADDTIRLENAIFTALATTGTLASTAFVKGTAAADSADRIIYDSVTGNLWYDSDGTGAAAKILFGNVGANLLLTNADFVIV